MQIAIVGAGIVGVTTAYELACNGHAVTVFEQRNAAAEEASFANAGLLAPSVLIPWALPAVTGALPHPLWSRNGPVRLSGGGTWTALSWLRRWRKAGREPYAAAALAAHAQLGALSQQRMDAIAGALDIDPERSRGCLIPLRPEANINHLQPALQVLRDAGVPVQEITPEAARQIEPGLSPEVALAGALYLPQAEAGNGRLFAHMLRYAAQERGVQFQFGATVAHLTTQPTAVQLAGEPQPRRFDAIVLCAGEASATLLRPLGIALPLAAVRGYSISAPVREDTHAPQGAVIDPLHRATIVRIGQRVRVAGGAELGTADAGHHEPTLHMLYNALAGWFPGGAQLSSATVQVWRGVRPTLPDGLPLIGASGLPGLWLNTAHGASGWALACGSAHLLGDLIAQRTPSVDPQPFGLRRF